VSDLLLYGQLVKRRNKKKGDGLSFVVTRMKIGRRRDLVQRFRSLDFSGIILTAIIERFNLTLRHGVAPLRRKIWAKAHSNEMLYLHVQWWRLYYHFSREHKTLSVRLPCFRRRNRQLTPAQAAGITDRGR
jgi:hypothetical protein